MDEKIAAYRRADTMGKSQIDLILMVYDGALKALKTAREYYGKSDADGGYDQLQQAKRFITHLYTTLDMAKGGEVAQNLSKMYVWSISQLLVIEATKDMEELDAVVDVLNNLRSGWADIRAEQTSHREDDPAPTVEAPDLTELTEEFVTAG